MNALPEPKEATLQALAGLLCGDRLQAAPRGPWADILRRLDETETAGRLPLLRELLEAGGLNGKADEILRGVLERDPRPSPPATWAEAAATVGEVCWDWTGWIPRGFLCLLAASPGSGKSAFALQLASSYILGRPLPDGTSYTGERGSVLWLESEAGQALHFQRCRDWGLPKLLERVETPFADPLLDVNLSDPEHRQKVEQAAYRPEVRLIVLDSLRGALRGDENASEAGEALFWLAALARDTGRPCLILHHLRKKTRDEAGEVVSLDRVRGSSALIQPCRIVLSLDAPDPEDEAHKRLSCIKSNLAMPPEPLGMKIGRAGLTFGDPPERPGKTTQTDKGEALLRHMLQDGERPAADILEAAMAEGISEPTLHRAKKRLRVSSFKKGDRWLISLQGRFHDSL